jgi:hypothetical protein
VAELNFKQLRQDSVTVLTGEFPATIVEAEATINSSDNPMIKCKFKIATGPYAGRPIYNNFNITPDSPGALRIFFQQMEALGLGEAFFDHNPQPHQIAQELVGKAATLTVGSRTWQGVARENVEKVGPPPLGMGGTVAGVASLNLGGIRAGGPQSLPQSLPTQASNTPEPTTINSVPAVADAPGSTSTDEPALPF